MELTISKVYSDGSHFIAIPPTPLKEKKERYIVPDRFITVYEELDESLYIKENFLDFFSSDSSTSLNPVDYFQSDNFIIYHENKILLKRKIEIRKYFDELYSESVELSKKDQKAYIYSKLSAYFDNKFSLVRFVDYNLERQKRNLISRKVRLMRKALLQDWTYFSTFTYDSNKLHEEDFKRKLRTCLSHLSNRNGWKYLGVWEKSPIEKRLHFHSLLYVPLGAMVGDLKIVRDYSTTKHKMQESIQNSFFNDRFGRSDFKVVDNKLDVSNEIAYMCKYLTKTNGKVVYSKGLPDHYCALIDGDDIICSYGVDNRKYILFDSIKDKFIK